MQNMNLNLTNKMSGKSSMKKFRGTDTNLSWVWLSSCQFGSLCGLFLTFTLSFSLSTNLWMGCHFSFIWLDSFPQLFKYSWDPASMWMHTKVSETNQPIWMFWLYLAQLLPGHMQLQCYLLDTAAISKQTTTCTKWLFKSTLTIMRFQQF